LGIDTNNITINSIGRCASSNTSSIFNQAKLNIAATQISTNVGSDVRGIIGDDAVGNGVVLSLININTAAVAAVAVVAADAADAANAASSSVAGNGAVGQGYCS